MNATEPVKESSTISLPQLGARHQPLRQVVTDALRKAILSKRLKPGERLVEEQLAADLGVSRNPVREALRVLESEGLVEISPRRGASVTNVSEEEAQEIVEVRAALEGLCARLAARRCSPALKADIEKVLDRGESAAAADDSPALARIHSQVHALMARAGHNRHLNVFVQSLRDKTDWLYASSVSWRAQQSWREHSAILRAIADGDEELAAVLASRHVIQVGTDFAVEAKD
jgi:DNA-binding GntR family transcriptional regulator